MPSIGSFSRELKRLHIDYEVHPFYWWGADSSLEEKWQSLRSLSGITNFIKTSKASYVVSNTSTIPWGALSAAEVNIPHAWVIREAPGAGNDYIKEYAQTINNFSNVVFANSGTLARYAKRCGINKVQTMYSYVDKKSIGAFSAKDVSPRLVIIGNLSKRKNQNEALQALKGIHKNCGEKIELLLIGNESDKSYVNKMKSYAKKEKLEKYVVYKGYVDKPFSLLSPSDIILQPSGAESIGRVLTESMKLGLVCIATGSENNRETILLGDGLVYKENDVSDLISVVSKILNDRSLQRTLSRNAALKSRRNLSEESCHDTFFNALKNSLEEDNPMKGISFIAEYMDVAKQLFDAQEKVLSDQMKTIDALSVAALPLHEKIKGYFKKI